MGSQIGICKGTEWVAAAQESLFVFDIRTNLIVQQAGQTLDTDIDCKVGYYEPGRPRYYEYELKLMNARVSHFGTFSSSGYAGANVRLGVRQPFNLPLEDWPALFDNNFALQWEIAVNTLEMAPGDSVVARVVVPQLEQLVPVKVRARPNQVVRFEGENVSVRVLELVELSQVMYISHDGRLLRSEDPRQKIIVQRVEKGSLAEVERASFWDNLQRRAGPYLLLLAFAALWAAVIGWRNELRFDAFAVFVAGAAIYWASIQVLDPLQEFYFSIAINPRSPASNTYVTLLGSALLFAVIEQIAILIPIAIAHFLPYKKKLPIYIAIGAACGAGFGLMQSANLTSFMPDGAVASGELLFQKLGLVGISAVSGALFGLFLGVTASIWFYLIPIGMKGIQNWLAAFLQKGSLSQGEYIVVTLLVAAMMLSLYYWLRYRKFGVDKERR
jgi:hypothetical protein